jgi:Bacterial type II/III secretion system short domain
MHRAMCRRLAWSLLVLLTCAFGVTPGHARGDLSAPYAYQATGRSPLDVLRRFADDHGLNLRVAPAAARVAPAWRTARLAGWIRGESGRAFLEQLASAYHFDWFVANRTLHVSARADSTVERVALNGIQADAAQAALASVGLYDERFGWGELTAHDAVLVAGPREYVSLMRRFLGTQAATDQDTSQSEPMIFPLRYAQAADGAAFDSGDAARPGIASILQQLLAQDDEPQAPRFHLPAVDSMPAFPAQAPAPLPVGGQGLANWFGVSHHAPPPDRRARHATTLSAASRSPDTVIVGDERTNTILVWGDPALRPRLARIIEALDRPVPMVTMEVLVLEADEATVGALASDGANGDPGTGSADTGLLHTLRTVFDTRLSHAVGEQRATVLNRQALVGFSNQHVTLAIGAEELHRRSAPHDESDENANGRAGNRGDALDLIARLLPARPSGRSAIAVDVGFLMAQPTGLPGREWGSTSSVKLKTTVALEAGAAPRLVATYPVATSRGRQRAIFLSAGTL